LRKNYLFLSLCIALALSFIVVGCTPAATTPATPTTPTTPTTPAAPTVIEWKMATWVPPQHTSVITTQTPWIKEVLEKTGGRLKITNFPGAALGKAEDHYDLAAKGVADLSLFTQGFTAGRFPLSGATELPFVVTTSEATSRALFGIYQEFPEVQKEYADTHIIFLSINDALELYTTKKAVRTLEDLKGLTIRASGPENAAMLKALGATPILMPMTDLYTAMQKGTVDGCVALYEASMGFRLHEVTKYVTAIELSTVNDGWTVNKNSWDKLPADIKEMLGPTGSLGQENILAKNTVAFENGKTKGKELLKGAGVEFITLSPAEKQRFVDACSGIREQWIADKEAKGLPARKVADRAAELVKQYTK
jgi:TRAP-type transport system periplasmic protein